MNLNIICWNTRNLSDTIARPGVRGRHLNLDYRINCVITNLGNWKPDIAFLLEAGPDADDIAGRISSRIDGYTAIPSDVTQGESYIMVIKNGLIPNIACSMVGSTANYRQGWMVRYTDGVETLNMAVLHAPSPSHPIADRLGVINNVAQEAYAIDSANPIFLMGDLNIKSTEFQALSDNLTGINFTFAGPITEQGELIPTSLRRFTTILGGSGQEESGSQPYDQFWTRNNPWNLSTTVSHFTINEPETDNIVDWITTGMNDVVSNLQNHGMDLRGSVTVAYGDDLVELFNRHKALNLMLNDVSENRGLRSILDLPVTDWVTASNAVNNFAEGLGLAGITQTTSINLPRQDYNKAKSVLGDFTFYQMLADSMINYKTGGKEGFELLKSSIYEHGISDHLPIGMVISPS